MLALPINESQGGCRILGGALFAIATVMWSGYAMAQERLSPEAAAAFGRGLSVVLDDRERPELAMRATEGQKAVRLSEIASQLGSALEALDTTPPNDRQGVCWQVARDHLVKLRFGYAKLAGILKELSREPTRSEFPLSPGAFFNALIDVNNTMSLKKEFTEEFERIPSEKTFISDNLGCIEFPSYRTTPHEQELVANKFKVVAQTRIHLGRSRREYVIEINTDEPVSNCFLYAYIGSDISHKNIRNSYVETIRAGGPAFRAGPFRSTKLHLYVYLSGEYSSPFDDTVGRILIPTTTLWKPEKSYISGRDEAVSIKAFAQPDINTTGFVEMHCAEGFFRVEKLPATFQ